MKFTSILILLIIYQLSHAQLKNPVSSGARAMAIGNNAVTLTDAWAVLNNPAGLANLKNTEAIASYQTIFDFAPFNTATVGVVFPLHFGVAGLGITRFGDHIFNTQTLHLGFGHQVGMMQLGARINYSQYHIEGFGNTGIVTTDVGGIAQLSPEVSFGAYISNLSQSKISDETQERTSTAIVLGLSYQPVEILTITVTGEKELELAPGLRLGLEYQIVKNVTVRSGFSPKTKSHSFGAGIQLKKVTIDYGMRTNRNIGQTHSFGLTYMVKRVK